MTITPETIDSATPDQLQEMAQELWPEHVRGTEFGTSHVVFDAFTTSLDAQEPLLEEFLNLGSYCKWGTRGQQNFYDLQSWQSSIFTGYGTTRPLAQLRCLLKSKVAMKDRKKE